MKNLSFGVVLTALTLFSGCGGGGKGLPTSTTGGLPNAPPSNASLNGSYAFVFDGFDAGGSMSAAGSFMADGNGNLTSGIEDINRHSSVTTNATFTGIYSIGSDGRGIFTVSSAMGNSTFHFALDTQGNGRFIEFDNSGTRGSGIIKKQDSRAFSTPAIGGDYALGLNGSNGVGTRVGAVGRFHADGSGNLSQGAIDVNDAGTLIPTASWNGSYSVSSNGRGTAVLFGTAVHFSFYVVSSSELFFLCTDFPTLFRSGLVLSQSGGPFSLTVLKGPAVFNLTGQSTSAESSAALGQVVTDGLGGALGLFDENDAGNVSTKLKFTGAYSIAPNGRGTLDLQVQPTISESFVFYVVNQNQALLLETSGSAVKAGSLEPQSGAPFSDGSFSGRFAVGTLSPAVVSVPDVSGVASLDGSGNFSETEDQSTPSGMVSNVVVAGTYAASSEGRASITLTSAVSGNAAFYAVSPTKLLSIPLDSGNTAPAVLVLEQ
ncbi:MAG TPA: hypothetical protein VEV41_27385 [Terriglobales bacterium]|nr:hypothetical protein [Terriglobales bacterium]